MTVEELQSQKTKENEEEISIKIEKISNKVGWNEIGDLVKNL